MALVSYITDPLSSSSDDTLSSSVGDTYLDPDFADLQFDTIPPELDEATVDRLAKEEFDSRFGRFGGKQPPPWFVTEKSGKGGSMYEWLEAQGADPETRYKTFVKWYQDYRDWHVMQGLMDANTQKLFAERVRPYHKYLANTADESRNKRESAEQLKWATDLIRKEDPSLYLLPHGEILTQTTKQSDSILFPEKGTSFFADVSNASTRGLINRASSNEAEVVAAVAELAEDANKEFGLTNPYDKIMTGDKLTLDVLEERYKLLRSQGTKEENPVYMDKLVKLNKIRETTKKGSNPLERLTALQILQRAVPVGEQMESFKHFAEHGTLGEKLASTALAAPELFFESMSQSADVLAASFVGSAVGGPLGAGVLAGAFSYDMDQAAEFSGIVQEEISNRAKAANVNPNDRLAMSKIAKGVFQDKAFITDSKKKSELHAGPVAAFDALAALGGARFGRKLLTPFLGPTGGKIAGAGVAVAIDPTSGMAGEALGQKFAYGSIKDLSGVFAEAVGAPTSTLSAAGDFKYWQNETEASTATAPPAPPSPETKKRSLREKLAAESGKAKKGRVTQPPKLRQRLHQRICLPRHWIESEMQKPRSLRKKLPLQKEGRTSVRLLMMKGMHSSSMMLSESLKNRKHK